MFKSAVIALESFLCRRSVEEGSHKALQLQMVLHRRFPWCNPNNQENAMTPVIFTALDGDQSSIKVNVDTSDRETVRNIVSFMAKRLQTAGCDPDCIRLMDEIEGFDPESIDERETQNVKLENFHAYCDAWVEASIDEEE